MLSTIPRRLNLVTVTVLLVFLHVSQAAVSSKKGLGIHSESLKCGDMSLFTGVSWWFDWRSDHGNWIQCPHAPKPPGYIPMIADEKALKTAVIPIEAKYVMGFNEPNRVAGFTPERNAQLWPQVQHKVGNRKLVSPVVGGCDSSLFTCVDWFDRFFKHCRNCRVDYIAFHAYQCNPTFIMHAVEVLSRRFDKKIWLTGFRCMYDLNFMKTILPMLEKSPRVEKYAWSVSDSSYGLINHNQSKLTKIGQFYNNFNL